MSLYTNVVQYKICNQWTT